MVRVIVEMDATPVRAVRVLAAALHEHNKVLAKADPSAAVSYNVLGVERPQPTEREQR